MVFWIVIAGIALLCVALLVVAALRSHDGSEPAAAYDLRVYRDQLKEVDRDLARGVIGEADAERTRTEISRRILGADARIRAGGADKANGRGTLPLLAVLAAVLIGGSLWLYQAIGQPGYGDLPRSLREAHAQTARETRPTQADAEAEMPPFPPVADVAEDYRVLVQKLRDTVAARPDDLNGQMLLARNEAVLGNYTAAYQAQAEVLRLQGDAATGQEFLNYADMMILAAGGYISPEAEAALSAALKREPTNGGAQYYWGLMHAQTGRPDLAFRIWQRLLAASPPDAAWVPPIRAQIEEMAELAGETRYTLPPEQPAPGPSAADVEAAGDMTDAERQEMIRGMVDGLAERLATDGGSADEWARLIRALSVLGEVERARAIHDEARQAFAGDTQSLSVIQAAAADAGLIP